MFGRKLVEYNIFTIVPGDGTAGRRAGFGHIVRLEGSFTGVSWVDHRIGDDVDPVERNHVVSADDAVISLRDIVPRPNRNTERDLKRPATTPHFTVLVFGDDSGER